MCRAKEVVRLGSDMGLNPDIGRGGTNTNLANLSPQLRPHSRSDEEYLQEMSETLVILLEKDRRVDLTDMPSSIHPSPNKQARCTKQSA